MAEAPANDAPYRLIEDVRFGDDVVVSSFCNLYGRSIGDGTRIGPFVEIQRGVSIGAARCTIQKLPASRLPRSRGLGDPHPLNEGCADEVDGRWLR